MTTIGLTGGVGSGKSTVAQLLAAHGALVVDADAIAREVVAPGTPGLAAIVERFGAAMLQPNGSLDRAALAAVVFTDEPSRAALNAITHPRIAARTAEILATADPGQVVVHDVPLLVENNLAGAYDLVVVVEAPQHIRLARLESRGMSEAEARRRMASQATDDQRREVADVVLSNAGDLSSLQGQVEHLWEARIRPLR
jgi:dephospho-CoA kinase